MQLRVDLTPFVARSSRGGFTPKEQLPQIEKLLLEQMREALGEVSVRYDEGGMPISTQ